MNRTILLAAVAAMMTVGFAHADTCVARLPTAGELKTETAPLLPVGRTRPHYNTWVAAATLPPVPMPRPVWRKKPPCVAPECLEETAREADDVARCGNAGCVPEEAASEPVAGRRR
jgi:hypothetical protein